MTVVASLHYDARFAWTLGSFCFIGYLTHLSLDEIYSVDLLNTTIKRSFGTALKPLSMKYKKESMAMALATLLLWHWAPPASPFVTDYLSRDFAVKVVKELLPKETFFGVAFTPSPIAGGKDARSNDLTH